MITENANDLQDSLALRIKRSSGGEIGLQLNIKDQANVKGGTNEEVDSFCLLRSTINSKGTSSQELHHRLAFSSLALKALKKIEKSLQKSESCREFFHFL